MLGRIETSNRTQGVLRRFECCSSWLMPLTLLSFVVRGRFRMLVNWDIASTWPVHTPNVLNLGRTNYTELALQDQEYMEGLVAQIQAGNYSTNGVVRDEFVDNARI